MRLLAALAFVGSILFTASARADAPTDPVRLVPVEADGVVQIDSPRRLVEAATTLDLIKQLEKFDAFRELIDSTNYRRFYQLVAYFEKQLGAKWPELLERLGGGGAVVAFKLGPNPAPAMLVVQSKDEELLRKFVKLGLEIAEQELARQESKERPVKSAYRNLETVKLGDFHAALLGATLVIANKEEVLHRALDLHLDSDKKSLAGSASWAEARRLLPPKPLASFWLNMETVHKAPQAKEVFVLPRNDFNLTALFGGWLDVAGRSPFLCAALTKEDTGFLATIRLPRGREGSKEAMAMHIPPADVVGTLPLLEPKGVIYSTSYYLDLARVWEDRAKLLNAQQLKGFEEFDKNSGRFLSGLQISKLFNQAGPHHRVVVAHQPKVSYKSQPSQRLPAFAFVVDMRDADNFPKTLETVLRGAALLAGGQFKLKLVEEKHNDVQLIGYRFPDDGKPPNNNDVIYNFSPCFAAVGDQWMAASSMELGRELVDLLKQQAKMMPAKGGPAIRTKAYAGGGADLLQAIEKQLFAQTILDRAATPDEAKQQVRDFIALVRSLGGLEIESTYNKDNFRYDLRLNLRAKTDK